MPLKILNGPYPLVVELKGSARAYSVNAEELLVRNGALLVDSLVDLLDGAGPQKLLHLFYGVLPQTIDILQLTGAADFFSVVLDAGDGPQVGKTFAIAH